MEGSAAVRVPRRRSDWAASREDFGDERLPFPAHRTARESDLVTPHGETSRSPPVGDELARAFIKSVVVRETPKDRVSVEARLHRLGFHSLSGSVGSSSRSSAKRIKPLREPRIDPPDTGSAVRSGFPSRVTMMTSSPAKAACRTLGKSRKRVLTRVFMGRIVMQIVKCRGAGLQLLASRHRGTLQAGRSAHRSWATAIREIFHHKIVRSARKLAVTG